MQCVMCEARLGLVEIEDSEWLPNPWCEPCKLKETERSQSEDTIPNSTVTWRLPRFLIEQEKWYTIDGLRLGIDYDLDGNF